MGLHTRPSSPQPRLSLHAVVLVALASFLFGHYTKAPPQHSAPPTPTVAVHNQQQHAQHQQQQQQQQHGEPRAPAPLGGPAGAPFAEPQEASSLASELLGRLRPPVPAAQSGNTEYTVQPFQVLSWYPRVVLYPNFIDGARCSHIVELAKGKLEASGLAWRPDETPDPEQQTRTSDGAFLSAAEDRAGVLAWLERKIAAVTMLPVHHGEAFNVLRYRINARYESHMDTFDPKEFGEQTTQRMATVLVYLSDVEEGGETVFLREGKGNAGLEITDYKACGPEHFKYRPRRGDALLFYSLDPALKIDPRSLHGGCPVKRGEKWCLTKWIHEKPFRSEGDAKR